MKVRSVVLPAFLFVFCLVIALSFVSAVECQNGKGQLIRGSNSSCEGSFLVTETCVGSSAYNEKRVECQFGCDSIKNECKQGSSNVAAERRAEGAVTQEVRCVFGSSTSTQECFSESGNFSCTGTDKCIINLYALPGENITFMSSCEGSGNVIVVEKSSRTISFDCRAQAKGSETVSCIFKNASSEEKCYSGNYSCSGRERCSIAVSGHMGEKFIWKSTCGGEEFTVIDAGNQNGGNDYALFYCGMGEKEIEAYRQAYALCYDGYDAFKGNTEDCKTEEAWNLTMAAMCTGRCRGAEECGVKRFKAFTPCGNKTFIRPSEGSIVLNDSSEVCQGCVQDEKCYATGFRDKNEYCNELGSMSNYSKFGEACEKDYQCESNACNSVCGPNGFVEKIRGWFRGLFKK